MLRKRGARLHPNSGAGHVKWDGSDEDFLYEIKDTRKSFSLTGSLLRSLFRDAVRQGKQPRLLVRFSEYDLVAEISITPGIDGFSARRRM